MKFKKHIPRNGEIKTITKFLWLPLSIDKLDHWETRWLEKVTIEYQYQCYWDDEGWVPIRFID